MRAREVVRFYQRVFVCSEVNVQKLVWKTCGKGLMKVTVEQYLKQAFKMLGTTVDGEDVGQLA